MHDNIDMIERKTTSNVPGGTIIIKCKDFRTIQLSINISADFQNVATSLERLCSLGRYLFLYLLYYNTVLYFLSWLPFHSL